MNSELRERLASPCCQRPILDLTCTRCGRAFREIAGQPVLIDFERSILDASYAHRTDAAPPVTRRGRGRFHRIHNWLEGGNEVAAAHIGRLLKMLPTGSRVLVVGGGSIGKGTEALYDSHVTVTSFDIYASEHTDLVADAHDIPFVDGTFDAVIVQAILEHVLDPPRVVSEIHRVLTLDGLVYAETPFLQQVHEGPYDFQRFTESGHRWLFRQFELLDSGVVAGAGYQMLWSAEHLARTLFESRRAGYVTRRLLAYPLRVIELKSRKSRYAVDTASCVFFFGQSSDRELTPAELIAHYRGAQRD